MKRIIFDATPQGAEASAAINTNLVVSFNDEIIQFQGNQATKSISGREVISGLPVYFGYRGKELAQIPTQGQPEEIVSKNAAKKVLADAFLLAVENATQAYLEGVFQLENPTVETQEEEEE